MGGGLKGFFYPELCERLFDELRVSTGKLPLGNTVDVLDDEVQEGTFGKVFRIDGWLGVDLPVFPRDEENTRGGQTRCCLKVVDRLSYGDPGRVKDLEPMGDYARRCYLEYDLLRKANGASGRVPRPLAMGPVVLESDGGKEVRWAICMEYLPMGEGTYLINDRRCESDRFAFSVGQCTYRQIATLAYELCLALIDLHKTGVTHRDLYYNNVAAHFTMSPRGGIVDRVYLIDLGNSAREEADATLVDGRDGGVRLAHRAFGAPEVFAIEYVRDGDGHIVGREEKDYYRERNKPAADIWSFGAILYYYCTERWPPINDQPRLSYYRQFAEPKKGGLRVLEDLKKAGHPASDETLAALDEIVKGCTEYAPSKRMTLVEVQHRLEGLLGITRRVHKRPLYNTEVLSPAPTQEVQVGQWCLSILLSYERVKNNRFFHEFVRHEEGLKCSLMVSSDSHVPEDRRGDYTHELIKQAHELYDKSSVEEELHHMDSSNSGEKTVHTFSIEERLADDTVFVSKNCSCFVGDSVIRLGLACQLRENDMEEHSKAMDRELAGVVRSIRLI